jgi:glycosyltransferase involved in cell wall biosynthesis
MLKILHMAPQNYAGVPYDFYRMHNACGDQSRLITYHKNQLNFPEDICLNIPLPKHKMASFWRRKKMRMREEVPVSKAPYFEPKNFIEKFYFSLTDLSRKSIAEEIIEKYDLDSYDIIHYDAGLDLFRNSSLAKRWKKQGKKIVCCYYGSDLRLRGIIKELDEISDLNITSEYDHLSLKTDLHYIFYPYDPSELPQRKVNNTGKVKIVHSPTNRKYKGTELIISVIDKVKESVDIEFLLLENMDREEVLKIKSGCDIAIDQVGGSMGGTGYGKAGIETLAMGIPTITNMTEEYARWLRENPFIIANNGEELYKTLIRLTGSPELRNEYGTAGKAWVEKYHGYKSVDKRLKELYAEMNII